MKLLTKKSIPMYLAFIAMIVFLTGAECSIGGCSVTFNDYTGKAVNVKAAATSDFWKANDTLTLTGATVKLIPLDENGAYTDGSNTISTTVDANGEFDFLSLYPNRYKLTGEWSGWTFVPRYVEVTGDGMQFPDLLAYLSSAAVAGEVTIITSWQNTAIDIDSILTYGGDNDVLPNNWSDTATIKDPEPGSRTKIDAQYAGSTEGIKHDRDIKSSTMNTANYDPTDADVPRVETITFYTDAWLDDNDVAYFYVDSYFDEECTDPEISTADYQTITGWEGNYDSAYAQVDVMIGTEHFGTWVLPWNTAEDTLKVVRIRYHLTAFDDPTTTDKVEKYEVSSANNADGVYGGVKMISTGK